MGISRWVAAVLPARVVRAFRSASIVAKLTVFVGVLVALNTALLTAVAYVATDLILREQVEERLTSMAMDRQEMLVGTLNREEERAAQLANRTRLVQLMSQLADGKLSREQFREDMEGFLSLARANPSGLLALWIEDVRGNFLMSSGPTALVESFSRAARVSSGSKGGLAVPPRRIGDVYGAVFSGTTRRGNGADLGKVFLVFDLGPAVSFLVDPQGLGRTGEVLVGIDSGEGIRLLSPPRSAGPMTRVLRQDFPTLAEAISGKFGFKRTTDYRGEDVLVAYRPIGADYGGLGLIAKIDTAEAYQPVVRLQWLLLGTGAVSLAMGLGASNAIARRFSRPIRRLASTTAAVAAGNLDVRSDVLSSDEIGALGHAFNRMTEELSRSYATLERRIAERTRDLEAIRDLLDAFFHVSTSRLDNDNIEKTFDSVLAFCSRLGYDLAMISIVDHDARVIRAVRGAGRMTEVIEHTVRSMEDNDILSVAVRECRVIIVPDSRVDSRCDPAAVERAGLRGQIVLPLVSDHVVGILQVASHSVFDPRVLDLRPLETLASHTARALLGISQAEEIRRLNEIQTKNADELARSEAALREQTRILQSVLDCMGDGVVVANSRSEFLVFNPAAERLLGRGPLRPEGEEWSLGYHVYHPDRVTPYRDTELPLVRAIEGESRDQVELFVAYPTREDGTFITVTGRPLRNEQGTIEGGVVVFHDITRRKKAEQRLAAQYQSTRVLAEVDSPGDANTKIIETICECLEWEIGMFWRVDPYTRRLRCATFWQRSPGGCAEFERASRELILEEGMDLPGRAWATCEPKWTTDLADEADCRRSDAARRDRLHAAFVVPIKFKGECLGILEFVSHETRAADQAVIDMVVSLGMQIGQLIERHQMRGRVVQSEKLASLGLLSAGVAHEINNPLAYIANNLAVLERDVRFLMSLLSIYETGHKSIEAHQPEVLRAVSRIAEEFDFEYVKENMGKLISSTRQGVNRVADIVQSLRGFARIDRMAVDQADVREAARSALEMIQARLTRRNIRVEDHLGALPKVTGAPAQLNQVFLNLLVNAMQAIEATHRADGRISLTSATHDGEVSVEVADNGCGISEEILPQIFDPFFTTKSVGDGTGLGLSITHSMVQDQGGRLEVQSIPGEGTRFRVILPVAGAER